MKRDPEKPNIHIRSNVYPMPETMASDLKILSILKTMGKCEKHFKFIHQITGNKLFELLPTKIQEEIATHHQNRFDFCVGHPDKTMTYGPIKKGNKIIFSCRCNLKDTCKHKRIAGNTCDTCCRNKG